VGAGSLWPNSLACWSVTQVSKFCHLATKEKKIGAVTCGKDGFGKNGPQLPYFIDFFLKSPYLDHWFLHVTIIYIYIGVSNIRKHFSL